MFSFMVHICKMIISMGIFLYFFRTFILWVIRGLKEQKIVPNDKTFCLSRSISQETCIMWSSFVVCKCKMITSSGAFFYFFILWFFRLSGGSKGKEWPKMTKNSVCRALYLRNHTSYDLHLWCTRIME